MQLANEMKELRFELTGSSGRLSVEKDSQVNKSDTKLQIGQGAIVVRGTTSFGNQSYK